ncbi:adenylate/guanylate cyclase domain-containing protein [candidate division CSSED10-310 bacterium]|uniref:Adenylate/guanylate cyclase domain-containing protein n=1 Tax=candidate division CSSED10-310 bacterium TaxID=2855610 RepID=A0ABV6YXA4_UNCC1
MLKRAAFQPDYDQKGYVMSMHVLERFLDRIGNPLEWSFVDKTLLLLVFYLSINIPLTILGYFAIQNPGIFPDYFNPETTLDIFRVQLVFVTLWIILTLMGFLMRRLNPHIRWIAYANAISFSLHDSLFVCWIGHSTNSLTLLTLFAPVFFGLLLYNRSYIMLGICAAVGVIVFQITAEQLGLISYAPGLLFSPASNGLVDHHWVALNLGIGLLVVALTLVIFGYVLHRWRERENQIAVANRAIRHYVPSQVADRILAGDFQGQKSYERRTITVFFSDIKDFTETADQLEAEKLSELLNEYLTEMSEIAVHFGATIDKFVGDAIMIFFGAPLATNDKDHAFRAVHMAIEMQERMIALRQKWYESGIQIPFQIRMGINTGVANVGTFGSTARMEYTAIGNQVNLAARLESHCEPGEILISHSTWGLVHDHIQCLEKGELEVKGLHYPVKVYEVQWSSSDEKE